MRIIRGINAYSQKLPNPVLTLGNFDGVHLGHQAIFKKVVERAKETGGTAVAFTFEPHPLKVLAPERSPLLLNTFHGKMKLIEASGIQVAICADFTREFAEQNPEDFARRVLAEKVGVKEVYVGYDYAFGKGREGSIESLKAMGADLGFTVGVVDAVLINGVVVSSSLVRDLVASGRVDEVYPYLGRHYAVEGNVIHGDSRGHTLGFPTANIHTANELLPAFGVYAVRAFAGGHHMDGVASVGVRPTFGSGPVSIEVYLFNFDGNLYGKHLEISFIRRLRGEQKFPDADALVRQMHRYVEQAKEALAGTK
jgi:riboflavin kinase/FMN adenylyltransferase